ncbi:LysE family translocator [Candidatus Macondimonas diazotrophica]|jgi:threonine/homoserine/homoserine lactone efflux protein|uniref:LysE family translocator n=2 Tax=Candidatus Macondimonas diazotrophica TaxID=2305248 RepID=A0A4Z0FAP1_9GAMM|nr:LysE family translocator [Candidatus Macondimonas diazotrophica]
MFTIPGKPAMPQPSACPHFLVPINSCTDQRCPTMEITLHLSQLLAMFGAMVVLAAAPSVSVLTVMTQTTNFGFRLGAWLVLGVVTGDIVFIFLATFALTLLTDRLGTLSDLLRYAGSGYLIWLGITHWRRVGLPAEAIRTHPPGRAASYLAGLLITLADQKAILFYLAFFPAFFDLARVTPVDLALVILICALAVGGTKLGYAATAHVTGRMIGQGMRTGFQRLAACSMMLAGLAILLLE